MSSTGSRGPGWKYRVWAVEAWERSVASKDILVRQSWERVAVAYQLKLEGIVSKQLDKSYVSGRRGQWTKTKCRPRQELVIGGWEMNGARFPSLLLGA